MRVFFFRGVLVIIIAAMALCVYQMFIISNTYIQEEQVQELAAAFAPSGPAEHLETIAPGSEDLPQQNPPDTVNVSNPSILEAMLSVNEDITAWIRVPNTHIDYPVVHGEDNSFYLDHDIYKQYAAAGSIFIDSRNNKGFVDFNTIIYGHNMKNGTMFGNLSYFSEMGYFLNNPNAQIFLPETTYTLEIFAFMRLNHDDSIIYGSVLNADFTEFIEYVKLNAVQYRDIQLNNYDRLVTLSTCINELADARMVLLARLNHAV